LRKLQENKLRKGKEASGWSDQMRLTANWLHHVVKYAPRFVKEIPCPPNPNVSHSHSLKFTNMPYYYKTSSTIAHVLLAEERLGRGRDLDSANLCNKKKTGLATTTRANNLTQFQVVK
jgi:hypothetical protein